MTKAIWSPRVAIISVVTLFAIAVASPASAVVPEIVLDPRTAKADPQADLETALVEISLAQIFATDRGEVSWRRAPWHVN